MLRQLLDKSGIHVAEYLTALPPRGVLIERLHQATQRAQSQIEQRSDRETGHDNNSESLSGILCVRHSMSARSMYAKQDD